MLLGRKVPYDAVGRAIQYFILTIKKIYCAFNKLSLGYYILKCHWFHSQIMGQHKAFTSTHPCCRAHYEKSQPNKGMINLRRWDGEFANFCHSVNLCHVSYLFFRTVYYLPKIQTITFVVLRLGCCRGISRTSERRLVTVEMTGSELEPAPACQQSQHPPGSCRSNMM